MFIFWLIATILTWGSRKLFKNYRQRLRGFCRENGEKNGWEEGWKFSSLRISNRQSKAYHFRRVNWLAKEMGMTHDDVAVFYNHLSITLYILVAFERASYFLYIQNTNQSVYNFMHDPYQISEYFRCHKFFCLFQYLCDFWRKKLKQFGIMTKSCFCISRCHVIFSSQKS